MNFSLDELGLLAWLCPPDIASRHIIRRDEVGAISGQDGNPHEVCYRFGDREFGFTGNNGTSNISHEASIDERRFVGPTPA